jgi:hypothetical protein
MMGKAHEMPLTRAQDWTDRPHRRPYGTGILIALVLMVAVYGLIGYELGIL